MANYYDQAGEAIGAWVRQEHQTNAHNWGNIVPSAAWGMQVERWEETIEEIRAHFEALIKPCRIRQGETLSGARTKPLYILQERMANSVVCPGDDDHEEG